MWAGHRAAFTLTFDDALACQLKHAVPAMTDRGIFGTFFAITNSPEYPLDVQGWRPAFEAGHEVGSHTVNHRKAASLSVRDADLEAQHSKHVLENHFGKRVDSFCYPYTDAIPVIQDAVKRAGYKQARGGRAARVDKYVTQTQNVNYLNLPCFHINDGMFHHGEGEALVDAALERNAWLTFMFHAVGDETGWDNVTVPVFVKFLDFLADRVKNKGLLVTTFGKAAELCRSKT